MSEREIYRILDAAANRGREALRVIEDAARFIGDSERLTTLLKDARHRFAAAADKLDRRERMLARDTSGDVGTSLETQDEYQRSSLLDVLVANFARLEESARSLEEFSKIVEPNLAREWEQIRYSAYVLEKLAYEVATQNGANLGTVESDDSATPTKQEPPRQPETQKHDPDPAEPATPKNETQPPKTSNENAAKEKEDSSNCASAPENVRQPSQNRSSEQKTREQSESTSPGAGMSVRGARRAKLYHSRLCVYVDRTLSTPELRNLLDSDADMFELSFDAHCDAERVEETEDFLRQWFNKYPSATRSLDGRPLLLSRDTRLWGDALDGWVVPIESAVNARDVIGPDALLGVVVSSRDDALAALQAWSTGYVDFIEVGPVFTNQGVIEPTNTEFLRALEDIFNGAAPLPIFAFGGIDETNCGEVFDAGVERLGIGEAILSAQDKKAAVSRVKSLF